MHTNLLIKVEPGGTDFVGGMPLEGETFNSILLVVFPYFFPPWSGVDPVNILQNTRIVKPRENGRRGLRIVSKRLNLDHSGTLLVEVLKRLQQMTATLLVIMPHPAVSTARAPFILPYGCHFLMKNK